MAISVAEMEVADPADSWARAGFSVDTDAVCPGSAACASGWSAAEAAPASSDGRCVACRTARPVSSTASRPRGRTRAPQHPPRTRTASPTSTTSCCSRRIWVEQSKRSPRSASNPRRERETQLRGRPIRQIFFRFGQIIVEVVGSPDAASEGPSTLWGITYVVADIDATAAYFGDRTAPVKEAVQPGRRITTLRHDALGMSVRSAMISAPILGS